MIRQLEALAKIMADEPVTSTAPEQRPTGRGVTRAGGTGGGPGGVSPPQDRGEYPA